jgi:hypothetical protein
VLQRLPGPAGPSGEPALRTRILLPLRQGTGTVPFPLKGGGGGGAVGGTEVPIHS